MEILGLRKSIGSMLQRASFLAVFLAMATSPGCLDPCGACGPAQPGKPVTTKPIFVPTICDTVVAYPAGAGAPGQSDVSPLVQGNGLCFPDGIAVDRNNNIYVTNENSVGTVTEYAAGSNGTSVPIAVIAGAATGLNIPGGIALDEAGNIYVANTEGGPSGIGSVTVYASGSSGNIAPIATISGPHTSLNLPVGVALDDNGTIYVANQSFIQFSDGEISRGTNSVLVYPARSNGDAAPSAVIKGPNTHLNNPQAIAVDHNGRIFVLNTPNSPNGSITVYAPGSSGNAKPTEWIHGRETGVGRYQHSTGIAVDSSGNIYVAGASTLTDSVSIYAAGSTGNVPPKASVSGSNSDLNGPFAIAVDRNNNLYVTNVGTTESVQSANSLDIFAAGSTGNATPIAMVSNGADALASPSGIAMGVDGRLYVASENGSFNDNGSVAIFPPGAFSNPAVALTPSASIAGPHTKLDTPNSVATDGSGNIYVTNQSGGIDRVTIYAAGSNGDATPMAIIQGPQSGLNLPYGIALDPRGNIYVANYGTSANVNTVTIYSPSIISSGGGDVAPIARISGPKTALNGPQGIALDGAGNVYVANNFGESVTVYPPLSQLGKLYNKAPQAAIFGPDTGLNGPEGLTLDDKGNIYVTNYYSSSVTVYAALSTGDTGGDVEPSDIIQGVNTQLEMNFFFTGIAVGP